jgi:hypothetical protein
MSARIIYSIRQNNIFDDENCANNFGGVDENICIIIET